MLCPPGELLNPGKCFSVDSNGKELLTSQEAHRCLLRGCSADTSGVLARAQPRAVGAENRIADAFARLSCLEQKENACIPLVKQQNFLFLRGAQHLTAERLEVVLETELKMVSESNPSSRGTPPPGSLLGFLQPNNCFQRKSHVS